MEFYGMTCGDSRQDKRGLESCVMSAEAPPEADIVADAGAQENCDDITLHVVSMSGETLAWIGDARPHWCYNDIVIKLPKLLPGHRYKLAMKEDVIGGSKCLGEVVDTAKTSFAFQLVAVVMKRAFAQRDMNLALVKAAGELDAQLVSRLLEANASPNYFQEDDLSVKRGFCSAKTPLHSALEAKVQDNDPRPWSRIIESLIAAKADVNAKRRIREEALCCTVSAFGMFLYRARSNSSLLKLFLEAKANVNAMYERSEHSPKKDGFATHYPIHVAVKTGDIDVVRSLLDADAHVDGIAVEHIETLQEEKNCVLSLVQTREETSLHSACKFNDISMVNLLLARRANANLLHRTTELGENVLDDDDILPGLQPVDDTQFGIRRGRCVSCEKTALHIALSQSNVNIVSLLVGAGADVSVNQKRGDRVTTSTELCGGSERLLFALQGSESLRPKV